MGQPKGTSSSHWVVFQKIDLVDIITCKCCSDQAAQCCSSEEPLCDVSASSLGQVSHFKGQVTLRKTKCQPVDLVCSYFFVQLHFN